MDLPDLNQNTLAEYLDLREEFLRIQYVETVQVGPTVASEGAVAVRLDGLWVQVRELHRLRLVFLRRPAPSRREWESAALQEAASDPDNWEARRLRAHELGFEMPGAHLDALAAEPVDRVTAGYRKALASV